VLVVGVYKQVERGSKSQVSGVVEMDVGVEGGVRRVQLEPAQLPPLSRSLGSSFYSRKEGDQVYRC
jgi:hypothetical protein